jgi:hypothetical protein
MNRFPEAAKNQPSCRQSHPLDTHAVADNIFLHIEQVWAEGLNMLHH